VRDNAGVAVAGALEDLPESEIRRVMETNFFGVLELTRTLLPTFRAQRRGRIVLVSSQAAFAGQPANSIYCASKWALEGWAESLAYEFDAFGIHVILIEPGPIGRRSGEARLAFCLQRALISRGCDRSPVVLTDTRQGPPATQGRLRSS
jgi:short-subunit dehydrogenase